MIHLSLGIYNNYISTNIKAHKNIKQALTEQKEEIDISVVTVRYSNVPL